MSGRRALALALAVAGEAGAQGAVAGSVRSAALEPLPGAVVRVARSGGATAREVLANARGDFLVTDLHAGIYDVTARRIGYREARLAGVRVADRSTVTLTVTLTQAARQLSAIEVETSPVSVDASTPALSARLDRGFTRLLPGAREATRLAILIPGARRSQLWGGAPGVSNDHRIDGIPVNHPGAGGDMLAFSVDWIETVEVAGLGAGAEHGNFQGGVINALTRSGSNDRRATLRTNYESERLAGSNFLPGESGSEPASRIEFGGEASGALRTDRLFYFAAGQLVRRELRALDLTTPAFDFRRGREEQRSARGVAKVSWIPRLGHRVDAVGGVFAANVDHAGLNGLDDLGATARISSPTTFRELAWRAHSDARNQYSVRVGGFSSTESRQGYSGTTVPGVRSMQGGAAPTHLNAAFDEWRAPSSWSARAEWSGHRRFLGADHRLVAGGELTRAEWKERRTRNGGLTWRPYPTASPGFDPKLATTWDVVGSEWGGEMHLDSDVRNEAVFVQDYVTLGSRLTVSPGVRHGAWRGFLRPTCAGAEACHPFEAVRAMGWDPRLGAALDPTGRGHLAVKVHWGRYHQGMYALFFDRAQGGGVHTNERFYYSAPPLASAAQSFTPGQRDAPGSGFSRFFDEFIRNEEGRVDGYRQPYVDQLLLAIEQRIASRWKAEVVMTERVNRDIAGLVDRNLASNYSRVYNTRVDHRLADGRVLDAFGAPLVLPVLYVSNRDVYRVLHSCGDSGTAPCSTPVAGYTAAEAALLPWNPDVVLTTLPAARRRYRQATVLLRAHDPDWRAEASITGARLRGNVAGVTGYGVAGTRFSAGPFVRPNERINFEGFLPDALEFEAKLWAVGRLPWSFQGGVVFTHTLGERFAPGFEFTNRYVYADSTGRPLPTALFATILGQSMFVEPRGSRQYASRDILDVHLRWTRGRLAVTADLFNVTGSGALTLINTNIGDQTPSDPTSFFGAARQRVEPRRLRLGLTMQAPPAS